MSTERRLTSRSFTTARAAVVAALLLSGCAPAPPANRVQPNDNRRAAGTLRKDTLSIRLVVRTAEWRAESDTGPALTVAAFAEENRAPQIPAPLIRVREGTAIVASVRNALSDSTIKIIGLSTHPSTTHDTLVLRPGDSATVRFAAGKAGTYLYYAILGNYALGEREQAAGAFVVDPPGGSPPDRVFVINIWGNPVDSLTYSNALAINGRSWPWTERIDATVGDTLRWRIVNATGRPHPMHLHGAYYRIDSKSDPYADTTYADTARRLVVTEEMLPLQSMLVAWSPVNEGRWLFHCHIAFHAMASSARITPLKHSGHEALSNDPAEHMAGLVLGITAHLPRGASAAARATPRTLDLFVQEGKRRGRSPRALGFVLQEGANAPAPDSVRIPGTPLILTRDEPTDVVVHNRLQEPVAIHWHGLELESFSDGVAGWSGTPAKTASVAAAGGTFTARLTMPRAGTFIYHTHVRDLVQLESGLYGGIVVLEKGQQFDPRTDHLHVVGWDADGEENVHLLVNGDSVSSPPIEMRTGETHRFRFVNIGPAAPAVFCIKRDTTTQTWRAVAKDGADLPPSQRVVMRAEQFVDVGETYDFEFTAPAPGVYTLSTPNGPKTVWTRRIVVK